MRRLRAAFARVGRGARRRAWRAWYRLRFVVHDRRRLRHTRLRRVAGLDIAVLPGVLDPALFFSSEVLVAAVRAVVRPGATVLDLGTGTGIGAIAAAEAGAARIVATDVDPVALRCARANTELHGLAASVDVRAGDLFAAVPGERFEVVAFNPPYLRGAGGALATALRADPGLPGRFARGLGGHLAPGGVGLLVLSTVADVGAYLRPLAAAGFAASRLVERDRGSELVIAWRLEHRTVSSDHAREGHP